MSQASEFAVFRTADAPKTQDEINARDGDMFAALLSNHSGAARPNYAVAGTLWADLTTGRFYKYDGTDDAELILRVDVPATAAATGTPGQFAYDASFAYFCTATDTWVRVAVATW
ncbi:MAG: hypothetical protein COA84_15065 [Robiginitomaculum sp.]|nr:MAG: hypothetical protein COA84_15065 [Robiginitomaculum sp.]